MVRKEHGYIIIYDKMEFGFLTASHNPDFREPKMVFNHFTLPTNTSIEANFQIFGKRENISGFREGEFSCLWI